MVLETFGGKGTQVSALKDIQQRFSSDRFPYIAYKNGGGAFLIPYLIVLFFIGKPFYFLEMILGQFTSKGSMKAVQVVPLMKGKLKLRKLKALFIYLNFYSTGVGWGQQIASASIATYYSAIVALTLSYVIKSFAYQLPWSTCEDFDEKCFPAESLGRSANGTEGAKSSAELFFK